MTKEQIGEVIKNTRLSAGFTQKQLSELLKRPQQTIANWEVGRSQPDANTLFELFQVLGADINEAFGFNQNKKSPLSEEDWSIAHAYHELDFWGKRVVRSVIADEQARMAAEKESQQAVEPDEDNVVSYPFLLFRQASSAGFGDWADEEYAETVMLVKEPPLGASFIIPVNGDSMEPTYQDGCKVFVRSQNDVRVGQIGIFFMDGKLWIKERGNNELISHNDQYPPQPFQEDIRCWGLVLGICDASYFA